MEGLESFLRGKCCIYARIESPHSFFVWQTKMETSNESWCDSLVLHKNGGMEFPNTFPLLGEPIGNQEGPHGCVDPHSFIRLWDLALIERCLVEEFCKRVGTLMLYEQSQNKDEKDTAAKKNVGRVIYLSNGLTRDLKLFQVP